MRTVGLREFNRNLYKELRDVPFIVTRDKKPVFIVLAYDEELVMKHNPYPRPDMIGMAYADGTGMKPDQITDTEGKPNKKFWDSVKSTLTKKVL